MCFVFQALTIILAKEMAEVDPETLLEWLQIGQVIVLLCSFKFFENTKDT